MKYLSKLISVFCLLSCSFQHREDLVFYVIKHSERATVMECIDGKSHDPLPPSTWFYGHHNFIMIDTSSVFYHNRSSLKICTFKSDSSKPPFINLETNDLIEIKIHQLDSFASAVIPNSDFKPYPSVIISSPSDTIRNRGYNIIKHVLNNKGIDIFETRNSTQEEIAVIAKKNDKPSWR